MLRQCLAGILAGVVLVVFGLFGGAVPVRTLDNYTVSALHAEGSRPAEGTRLGEGAWTAGNTQLVEGTRLTKGEMADVVAGKKKKTNWWAVAGITLAVVGLTVAMLSGVALVGAAAAVVTGAATTGEVVFAGTAFLAGLGAATTGSAICDDAGC